MKRYFSYINNYVFCFFYTFFLFFVSLIVCYCYCFFNSNSTMPTCSKIRIPYTPCP